MITFTLKANNDNIIQINNILIVKSRDFFVRYDTIAFMPCVLNDFDITDDSSFQIKQLFTQLFHFKKYTAMEFSTYYHIYISGFTKYRLNDTNTCPFPRLH